MSKSQQQGKKGKRSHKLQPSRIRYKEENRAEKNRIKRLKKMLVTQPHNKQVARALEYMKHKPVK